MKKVVISLLLFITLSACNDTNQPQENDTPSDNDIVSVIDFTDISDYIEYNQQELIPATHFGVDNWLSDGNFSFNSDVTYFGKYVVCYEIETEYFHLFLWAENAESSIHLVYYDDIYYVRANELGGLTRVYIVGSTISWGNNSITLSENQLSLYNDFKVLINDLNLTD